MKRQYALGGLATIGYINSFVPMCNGRGAKIIKGMAEELFSLSVKYGFDTIPEERKSGELNKNAKTRYVTKFSAPIFLIALAELVKNEGVDILFDTIISKPIMEESNYKGLMVEN